MSRTRYLLLLIPVLMLMGCFGGEPKTEPIKPVQLISQSEAEQICGSSLTLQYGAVVDMGNNTYTASYYSEPVGKADPVIVTVIYPSNEITETAIKQIYEDGYNSRDSKRRIDGIGDDAYVAFPSLSILKGGHLIKITAGSGETKEQLNMLIDLGKKAVENFENYYQ